ncbi:uncharacterized protein, partial [Triticum aestivum]|uniref:uncharacterized protein n=1 Tax=Triticum aestivum TaxID=4565 RepID=UPI001D016BCE
SDSLLHLSLQFSTRAKRRPERKEDWRRRRPRTSPSPAAARYSRVNPAPNLTCVDGKRPRQSATPADPVCKVLGDDNLLIEILLLIGYPTTLVRADLVYKRWLCHASDLAFLCRFRKLHPPRLLGFYVDTGRFCNSSCLVPMLPHPPEFNAIIRSASSILDACSNTH